MWSRQVWAPLGIDARSRPWALPAGARRTQGSVLRDLIALSLADMGWDMAALIVCNRLGRRVMANALVLSRAAVAR